MSQSVIIATLVVYQLALIAIGLWASRRSRSEDDFLLGGRGLGAWVAGLSYAASTSSAWVYLGFTGFVFVNGLVALWMVPGIWLGYAVVWLWFGPKLRAETEARGHVTLTDFLAAETPGRFRPWIAATAALLIVVCFVFYIAAQLQAAGAAFDTVLGLGRTQSVLVGASVILLYSLLGGFWAVSVTDVLQGAIMGFVALLVPALALIAAGGPVEVLAALGAHAPASFLDWRGGKEAFLFLGFALGVFSIGLGTLGQPHLLARLMAVRDEAARRRGFRVAMSWGVAVYLGMTTLALCGRALMPDLAQPETLFYRLAGDLLPAALAGVVVAAILSAVMSTVDSILLASAGAVAHDLGVAKRFPQREVLVARLVMVGICAAAIAITLFIPAAIFGRVLFAWSALGAAFGPIVVARVAGREPRPWAILAAMVVGFALTATFNKLLASGPGQIGERLLPWLPALAIVFIFSRPARRPVS